MKKTYNKVLITGASSGIGKALAYEFARSGSEVALLSRNTERLQQIQDDIRSANGVCHVYPCDVSVLSDVQNAIRQASGDMGAIDLAILNAGVGDPEWMVDFKSEYFKKTFGVNVFGIAHALEELIPLMKKQGGGTIAGVSSVTDVRGYPGSGSYCASKAAASALLESARTELLHDGIHVSTIRPGFVRTPMTDKNEVPMPFIISPEKAAGIIRKRIEKRHYVITFPLVYYLISELVRMLPNRIYTPMGARTRKA